MSYVIHQESASNIHEFKMNRVNSDAIRQLFDVSARIFAASQKDDIFMIVDAREAMLLPLRLLAQELRSLAQGDGRVKPCIAIVIKNRNLSEETSKVIDTILTRDRIALFTHIDRARMWLDLEMRRSI